ncbi:MAG: hypothetical protein QE285_03065 [Aquabacterium sp.]|nr:hypothetical protein [Aquabacterium sp.]
MPIPSPLQNVALQIAPQLPAVVLRWTLDTPCAAQVVDVRNGLLRVQGWLLQHPCTPADCGPDSTAADAEAPAATPTGATGLQLLWRAAGQPDIVHRQPFNCGRPDVIERVAGQPPAGHPQLLCGFAAHIALTPGPLVQGLELGFELPDGSTFWPLRIDLQPVPQVIEGENGQLYLDNDSNCSVDQYTGAMLLDPARVRQWRGFLADTRALARRLQTRHALVIAPAKEEVLRHGYPHARATTTVLDQVRTLARPDDHVVDGARVLAEQDDPAAGFKRTDTHWTDRGAMWVTLAALPALGCDLERARAWLANDGYRVQVYAGDLGVKLLPPRSAPTEFLDGPAAEEGAVFDNRLPNMGRVLVFEAQLTPFDMRLLLFGASSAYPMLKYLKRLFRRVVFVHSAGHVDQSVVQHEQPQALLLQSTARFLVQPPDLDFALADVVAAKLSESAALRSHAAALLAAHPHRGANAPYLSMLERHRAHA